MEPRIAIASRIYTSLILQDLKDSIRDPMPNAKRALLFADALLCAALSDPEAAGNCAGVSEGENRNCDAEQAIRVRAAMARFGDQMEARRTSRRPGSTLH